jgi:E3 SUMO-protein ligase RanBP2
MRRDQVLKICLNCFLTDDIEFTRKDDQSWTFAANDFSEGEYEPTSFAIRFKTKDISDAFKKAVDDAKSGKLSEASDKPKESFSEIVKRLMLPDNFFDYVNSADCVGCIGCKSDEYVYKGDAKTECIIDMKPIPLSAVKILSKSKPRRASQDKHVSFKVAEKKTNEKVFELFGTAKNESATEQAGKQNLFGIKKSDASPNIFAKFNAENPPTTTNTPTTTATSTSVFGSNSQSIFSGKTSFGSSDTGASIFSSSLNTTSTSTPEKTSTDPQQQQQPSLFGTKTSFTIPSSTSENIFGSANKENKISFGSSMTFGANGNSSTNNSNSVFGASVFGNALKSSTENTSTNIFGSAAGSFSFAEAAKELDKSKDPSKPAIVPDFLSKNTSFGGFAEIAQTAGATAFSASPSTNGNTSAGGFYGLTVKEDVFSKNFNKQNNADTSQNDESANDDNYDPHYDPIISLPDEIKVSTGEEDEEKLYGERAKLYRYDVNTKEWKERGNYLKF